MVRFLSQWWYTMGGWVSFRSLRYVWVYVCVCVRVHWCMYNLDINFLISRMKRVLKNILIIRPAWSQSFKCSMNKKRKKNRTSNELKARERIENEMPKGIWLENVDWRWFQFKFFVSIERNSEREQTKWLKNANGMVVLIEWHSKQVLKTLNSVLCTNRKQ